MLRQSRKAVPEDARRHNRALVLRTLFPNGYTATVRGVFTYKVNDEGLITNLRGYWNMDAMEFGQEEGGGD